MRQQVWERSDEAREPIAWHRARDEDRSSSVWRRWWRGVPRPPQQGGQDEEAAVPQAQSLRGRPHGLGARCVAEELPAAGRWWTVWGELLAEWHHRRGRLQFILKDACSCCGSAPHHCSFILAVSHLSSTANFQPPQPKIWSSYLKTAEESTYWHLAAAVQFLINLLYLSVLSLFLTHFNLLLPRLDQLRFSVLSCVNLNYSYSHSVSETKLLSYIL